jgi:tetratricopeptide (TPR) repeat protein
MWNVSRISAAETELALPQFLDSTFTNPMSNNDQTDPRNNFVPRFLPWILGAIMLGIYWFTLNHWINLLNLNAVAQLSGFDWHLQTSSPLTFLVTYPFHWLPAAKIPVALNLFAAICATLTLVILARCVALLPHDRTEAERQREKSDFAFLTGWVAWFPPILAVVMGGLQLTLWQHATNYTGETFALLLFAFIVWQLLEYRLDENDTRLFVAAVVYGASITDNWAMVAFFPLFLMAIIWSKRLDFFNLRFLGRLVLCGLAGLLLYLLLPISAKFSTSYPISVWEALKPSLRIDWLVIKAIKEKSVQYNLAITALTTLLPVLVMAIRWSASFGDHSKLGSALANNMIHFVHGVIFTVCIWVSFNPAFSPDHLMGTPCLPLYFLTALSIGYFCGYYLLLFSREPIPSRRSKALPILPQALMWLCPVIVSGVFIAAAFSVSSLVYRNHPIVRSLNDDTFFRYAKLTTQNLPSEGAILLCDSENSGQNVPIRSYLIQAMLAREGRAQNFPVIDTQSLAWIPYHQYLHKRFPKKWPQPDTKEQGLSPLAQLGLLHELAKSNAICYLNPSFGFYFEQFYQVANGLNYDFKNLPEDTLLPPPLTTNVITANEQFWVEAKGEFARIEKNLALQTDIANNTFPPARNPLAWFLMHLHAEPEVNPNILMAGTFYSRSLNFWGVQLQRANQLDTAATHFADAIKINPDNVVAAINLEFNAKLRAGTPTEVELNRTTTDLFGKYRNWNEVMLANGPFDETSFCFENAALLLQSGYMRQSVGNFNRVRQLVPDNLATRLFLAQTYIFAKQADRALEALHDPLTQPKKFALDATNSTGLNILAAAAYFQKDQTEKGVSLIEKEILQHPDDDTLLTAATQAYFMRNLYTNALGVIARKLAQSPNEPQWLFGKGYAHIQLNQFPEAIAAMTRVLEISTNDPTARFNRALAYLQSEQLDKARADYRELQNTYTNSYQVAFGLAEIGWRQHHTNEAISNYQIYLANAPTNSAEAKTVRERLTQLGAK